jgi:hypothetical protein
VISLIYKVSYSNWKNSLEIGETVHDVNNVEVKVLSIIKIDSYEGDTFVFIVGVKSCDIE